MFARLGSLAGEQGIKGVAESLVVRGITQHAIGKSGDNRLGMLGSEVIEAAWPVIHCNGSSQVSVV